MIIFGKFPFIFSNVLLLIPTVQYSDRCLHNTAVK